MAITFNSAGHIFAKVFAGLEKFLSNVEKAAPAISAAATEASALSGGSLPDYGQAVKAGLSVAGDVAAVLSTAGAAGRAKLADAGLDVTSIDKVGDLLKALPDIEALIKAL